MSRGWNYKSGDWYVLCDVCNLKIKASNSKHRWDGFIVCDCCFEQRHSQDFVKVRQDKITVPFQRPPSTDVYGGFDQNLNPSTPIYADTLTCTPSSSYATSGDAISGCAIAGKINPGTL
jgi:hypothetical protein